VPSVFVGHAGSKSFLADKRSLVLRNLRVLEERYPRYAVECAAFLVADPLQDCRARLEKVLLDSLRRNRWRVVLSGSGTLREIAEARARQLAADGTASLVIEFERDGRHLFARISDVLGGLPQSLSFDLASESARDEFFRLLLGLDLECLEIADLRHVPRELFSLIREKSLPYRLLITDTTLAANSAEGRNTASDWRQLVQNAQGIIALDHAGAAFARERLHLEPHTDLTHAVRHKAIRRGSGNSLGVLALRSNAKEYRLIGELCSRTATQRRVRIIILGATFDDIKAMQFPHVHVTGRLDEEEVATLVQAYGINKLLMNVTDPVFGHPLALRLEQAGLPMAAIGWEERATRTRSHDLRLDPGLPPGKMVERILSWLG
jgi:hypothetical protein